jgi:septal ring factor EnvC (AmiA/AmiB activator)
MGWLPIALMASGCVPSSPITYLDWGLDQQPEQGRIEVEKVERPVGDLPKERSASCMRNANFEWPVKGALVRRFSQGSKETSNPGIDILGSEEAQVVSAWDGRVTYAGDLRGYGKVVLIEHCDNLTGVYANLLALSVQRGDSVLKGQNLGVLAVLEGRSEAVLHFELRERTLPIDPMRHLRADNFGGS